MAKKVAKTSKPPKMIKVAGKIYERLPEKIRVKGEVYEIVK